MHGFCAHPQQVIQDHWRSPGPKQAYPRQARHRIPPCLCRALKKVMVVESPSKATKIQKFLGSQYTVLASYGHVRDLKAKQDAVLPDNDFTMQWEVANRAVPRLEAIRQAVQSADKVIFATDPDREGEAISWHVAQELQRRGLLGSKHVERVTFTDITYSAVTTALNQPRQISQPLVEAYLARRALDHLVGFHISPLLWQRLPGAKSAGRVQSVALRLVCEREVARFDFVVEFYYGVAVNVLVSDKQRVPARITHVDSQPLKPMQLRTQEEAQGLADRVQQALFQVKDVSVQYVPRSPPPPFTTSTLQQEAARRLGFSVSQTMKVAQTLYEGTNVQGSGLISYMRTDSVQMSPETVAAIRDAAKQLFGPGAVTPKPRQYQSRAKNSQEAHEAIRPTDPLLHPDNLPTTLDAAEQKLYRLIWCRAAASQMKDAVMEQVGVDWISRAGDLQLRSSGSRVHEAGFLQAYEDLPGTLGSTAAPATPADKSGGTDRAADPPVLLSLKGSTLWYPAQAQTTAHQTQPPPRYTEASLVKALEDLGIGRPSTYASTLSTLLDRDYLVKDNRALAPTAVGMDLSTFLTHYFSNYVQCKLVYESVKKWPTSGTLLVDYQFTSDMEAQLDDVSSGSLGWKGLLSDFWSEFQPTCATVQGVRVQEVYDLLDQELERFEFPTPESRVCPQCGTGRLQRKPSHKTGSFIGCSCYPSCTYTRPLSWTSGAPTTGITPVTVSERELGPHPVSGAAVWLKAGPYGPYCQVELPVEVTPGKRGRAKKPQVKRVSVPTGTDPDTLTLDQAVALLQPPPCLGLHPDDQLPVEVKTGRYGPYISHAGANAALPKGVTVEDVTLDMAVELLAKRAAGPRRGWGRFGKAAKSGGKAGAKAGTKSKASTLKSSTKLASKTTSKTASKAAPKANASATTAVGEAATTPKATPKSPRRRATRAAEPAVSVSEAVPVADLEPLAPPAKKRGRPKSSSTTSTVSVSTQPAPAQPAPVYEPPVLTNARRVRRTFKARDTTASPAPAAKTAPAGEAGMADTGSVDSSSVTASPRRRGRPRSASAAGTTEQSTSTPSGSSRVLVVSPDPNDSTEPSPGPRRRGQSRTTAAATSGAPAPSPVAALLQSGGPTPEPGSALPRRRGRPRTRSPPTPGLPDRSLNISVAAQVAAGQSNSGSGRAFDTAHRVAGQQALAAANKQSIAFSGASASAGKTAATGHRVAARHPGGVQEVPYWVDSSGCLQLVSNEGLLQGLEGLLQGFMNTQWWRRAYHGIKTAQPRIPDDQIHRHIQSFCHTSLTPDNKQSLLKEVHPTMSMSPATWGRLLTLRFPQDLTRRFPAQPYQA